MIIVPKAVGTQAWQEKRDPEPKCLQSWGSSVVTSFPVLFASSKYINFSVALQDGVE